MSSITHLPDETLVEIFKYLKNKILFSCLLVNRKWYRLIVPILWRSPCFKNRRVIEICFLELNANEKVQLIPFKINFPANSLMPLFEYTNFIISINGRCFSLEA